MEVGHDTGIQSGMESMSIGETPLIQQGIEFVKPSPFADRRDWKQDFREALARIESNQLQTEQILLTKIAELYEHIGNVWYKRFWNWLRRLFAV